MAKLLVPAGAFCQDSSGEVLPPSQPKPWNTSRLLNGLPLAMSRLVRVKSAAWAVRLRPRVRAVRRNRVFMLISSGWERRYESIEGGGRSLCRCARLLCRNAQSVSGRAIARMGCYVLKYFFGE